MKVVESFPWKNRNENRKLVQAIQCKVLEQLSMINLLTFKCALDFRNMRG